MSNLTILNSTVREYDNLFCLNDLHKLAGSEKKHQPYLFARLETTQDLIAELQRENPQYNPIRTLRGTSGGTYACEELAIAYATWISPAFHLVVLRAFLAMHKGEAQAQTQQLALPEPTPEARHVFDLSENELHTLAWTWFMALRSANLFADLYPKFDDLGSKYAPEIYGLAYEYRHTLQDANKLLLRLTEPLNPEARRGFALTAIRQFDPTFKTRSFNF